MPKGSLFSGKITPADKFSFGCQAFRCRISLSEQLVWPGWREQIACMTDLALKLIVSIRPTATKTWLNFLRWKMPPPASE